MEGLNNKTVSSVIASPDKQVIKQFFSKFEKEENKGKERVWVDIDKPLKHCTLHTCTHCTYIVYKKETPYKGINKLKKKSN